jgi:SET family sugar efflux transporter-like MFS transporter
MVTNQQAAPNGAVSPELSLRRRRSRALAPLVVVFLATGLSTALAIPFLTLFLSSAVHASPVQISVFLIAQPLCGVAGSTVLGRLSDGRIARRHVLLGAAVAGSAGAICFSAVRDYWLLLALACTITAVAGSLMPQSFAYARTVLAGDPAAAMLTSTLRTFFSLAWVAGPPLASLLLSAGGFRSLYICSALLYAVVVGVAAFWLSNPVTLAPPVDASDDAAEPSDAGRRALWLTLAGLVVVQSSMSLNVQALPLLVRQDIHGGVRTAGVLLGLCAALEIPAMLGFGALSTRVSLRTLVRLGPVFGAAYFVVAATAGQTWQLAVGQVVNACYIAIIGGLAISYVQELLPTQPGRASTLYSNTFPCGAILASPLLGLGAEFGYRLTYTAAIGLAVAGMLLIVAGARAR